MCLSIQSAWAGLVTQDKGLVTAMAHWPKPEIKCSINFKGISYELEGYGSFTLEMGQRATIEIEKIASGVMVTKSNDAFSPLYYNTPHVYGGVCDPWWDPEQFKREYLNVPARDPYNPSWLWKQNKEQEKEMEAIDLSKVNLKETIEARLRIMAYHDMHPAHNTACMNTCSASTLSAEYTTHGMTPCSKCNGLRAVVSKNNDPTYCNIYKCSHCNGTGVEPKPKTKVVPITELTIDECLAFLKAGDYNTTATMLYDAGLNQDLVLDMAHAAVRNCAEHQNAISGFDSVEIPNDQ